MSSLIKAPICSHWWIMLPCLEGWGLEKRKGVAIRKILALPHSVLMWIWTSSPLGDSSWSGKAGMLNDITSLLGLVWGLSAAQMLCTRQLLLHLGALEMRSDHRLGRVNASLGVLVPHFSGTQTDLSREACLLFGLLMLSPEVMLVYCTNQTIGFPPDPSLWVVLKPDDICRCLPVCLLPDLGPPPSWSGSIQFNSTTIYRSLLWPGAALTLEIQREISSLAQETPGLPALSYLTWYLQLPSYVKPQRVLKGAAALRIPIPPLVTWDGSLTLLEHWFLLYKKGIDFDH